MPYMQWMVDRLNASGLPAVVEQADKGLIDRTLAPGRSLTDIARSATPENRELGEAETRYLDAWPPALGEAIRAALHNALSRGERVQTQWVPAYDFEVHMWEARSGETPGGLIIQFGSPYPGDLPGSSASSA